MTTTPNIIVNSSTIFFWKWKISMICMKISMEFSFKNHRYPTSRSTVPMSARYTEKSVAKGVGDFRKTANLWDTILAHSHDSELLSPTLLPTLIFFQLRLLLAQRWSVALVLSPSPCEIRERGAVMLMRQGPWDQPQVCPIPAPNFPASKFALRWNSPRSADLELRSECGRSGVALSLLKSGSLASGRGNGKEIFRGGVSLRWSWARRQRAAQVRPNACRAPLEVVPAECGRAMWRTRFPTYRQCTDDSAGGWLPKKRSLDALGSLRDFSWVSRETQRERFAASRGGGRRWRKYKILRILQGDETGGKKKSLRLTPGIGNDPLILDFEAWKWFVCPAANFKDAAMICGIFG